MTKEVATVLVLAPWLILAGIVEAFVVVLDSQHELRKELLRLHTVQVELENRLDGIDQLMSDVKDSAELVGAVLEAQKAKVAK